MQLIRNREGPGHPGRRRASHGRAGPPLPFRYPAVIFGNAVGDHLLALPALRALAAIFPSRLSLICMPGFKRDFFSGLGLRAICEVEMPARGRSRVFDSRRVAERLGPCDLLLSLNPWQSPSFASLLRRLSPALSVGFSREFQVVLPKDPNRHAAEWAFSIPAHLDPSLRLSDFADPPRLPGPCRARVQGFLKNLAPGKRILAVHNETKPEKVWPRQLLRRLLESFLARHPEFVVFILDFHQPGEFAEKFQHRVLHSPGLPLPYAFAVIAESDLFLGANSCMLHAADLCRIPGVGLFGPRNCASGPTRTKYAHWGFRFSRHRHVWDARGMRHIEPSTVLDALESLLPGSLPGLVPRRF